MLSAQHLKKAQSLNDKDIEMTTLTQPLAKYSHVRKVGDLVFVAGQGCRDPKTNGYRGLVEDQSGTIVSYDISQQTWGVLENIERALSSIGLNRTNIVDIQVFLTTMTDFEGMNQVWNQFFESVEIPPTRTTVAVAALPGKNFVEMKAIAKAI
jgi:enamine deaminase RidA (YjgF/YER057c/UK114 family)